MWWWWACAADLIPGERVLGGERAAIEVVGAAGSSWGASLALTADGRVLVGAPGAGEVALLTPSGDELWRSAGATGLGTRVGATGSLLWAWAPGAGVYAVSEDGAPTLLASTPQATAMDVCPDGAVLQATGPGEAVACGAAGVLWSRCADGRCEVSLDADGDGVEEEILDAVGDDARLAWTPDGPCWGDPALRTDEAAGVVRCRPAPTEDLTELVGLGGDHLGTGLCEAYVAGALNHDLVPARARVVPRSGGEVLAVERAAFTSPLALACDADLLAIGVPGAMGQAAEQGAVWLVEAP